MYGVTKFDEYTKIEGFIFRRWINSVYDWIKSKTGLVTITAAYTVPTEVYYVRADATGGIFTVTLPPTQNQQARTLVVCKIDASGNAVTVNCSGSDTIQGSASVSLGAQWSKGMFISNGSNGWERLI